MIRTLSARKSMPTPL